MRLLPVLALLVAACADVESVRNAPLDSGETVTIDAPFDRVAPAAVRALQQMNWTQVSPTQREEGLEILVSRPPRGLNPGEIGRVFVERGGSPPTTLRVTYNKRIGPTFAEGGFARRVKQYTEIELQRP
jgi:hypothetical protein